MYALNSSSAAACNLFHYWHARRDAGPIAARVPTSKLRHGRPRIRARVPESTSAFDCARILDAAIWYRRDPVGPPSSASSPSRTVGDILGLDPGYLSLDELWSNLPRLRTLAEKISPEDGRFRHFHAAQIVKAHTRSHEEPRRQGLPAPLLLVRRPRPSGRAASCGNRGVSSGRERGRGRLPGDDVPGGDPQARARA